MPGYERVRTEDGETPKPGDVVASAEHVGIVSGEGKTVSVTTIQGKAYGQVVENDWGFRKNDPHPVVFLRYEGTASRKP